MISIGLALVLIAATPTPDDPSPPLDRQLIREGAENLARDARAQGDPRRGAILFYRPDLACAKCHAAGAGKPALGPDLAKLDKDVKGDFLVESILEPSKSIEKGYETITISTTAGRVVSGLLAEDRADAIVLRDPARDGQPVTIPKDQIDERADNGPSLMPAGLANILRDRQEFLDLARYVIDIAEGGPARSLELRPSPEALAPPPLPEYEKEIDHAGLIAGLGPENFKRGAAIFERVCANCHGTLDRPGSLPTSLRFASGTFKNGSDPFRMYQTLTRGTGQMAPQSWMVPRQKYDVIHYIREAFLREHNPTQYVAVDRDYLATLPKGTSIGPEPALIEPWVNMDYGPSLAATIEIGHDGSNIAYKGVAVRLGPGPGGVSRGRHWLIFEHDTLRVAGAWSGAGFIDWHGINFNGQHEAHPRAVGRVHFANPDGPGWADPTTGLFDDARLVGRDGHHYGPLPRSWGHFKGQYRHGNRLVFSYSIGKADVLESHALESEPTDQEHAIIAQTLNITRSPHDLTMRIAPDSVAVALVGGAGASLDSIGGFHILKVPAAATPLSCKLLISDGDRDTLNGHARRSAPPEDLERWTHGGPAQWPEVVHTVATVGRGDGPFAVDVLTHPDPNPWLCRVRPTGFDFLPDPGRAAVCTWDGDVWIVSGLDDPGHGLAWRRIAAGLFQPCGLKIVDGQIYVSCRDQIARLHDLNGDSEADFIESFNSDHQVTEHFHEFAMGLQTDREGNFYYTKAARHGKVAVVPQHGTLLRVSRDGQGTEILATGFRAPNGVCINDDGTFFLTDQEGFWTPKNRINLVRPGRFYGNMWGYTDITDTSDAAMEPPVCWITNRFDRSPAEMVRVTSDAWGPLKGSMLNFSYGYGKIFVVPHEEVGGVAQGGMCALPIPQFPTGLIRGRFHPLDGQLYMCGMFAWAGNQEQPGGFYRVRCTGKAVHLPIGLHAGRGAMEIDFSGPLDRAIASDPDRYAARIWSLKRTINYGSDHINEHSIAIRSARVSGNGRRVTLEIPGLAPTMGMEITYRLKSPDGAAVDGVIHNTIHQFGNLKLRPATP